MLWGLEILKITKYKIYKSVVDDFVLSAPICDMIWWLWRSHTIYSLLANQRGEGKPCF